MQTKDELGIDGESAAERYLVEKDFTIIARRARAGRGEIDLVAMDGGEIVFVEVKTRRGRAYGGPEEAVTFRKRELLRRGALMWLREHGAAARAYRIDVVAVIVRPDGSCEIEYFENAVGEAG